jgi:O-acetyl-ADP-ribose deacetylase (regulator of RNase III)
MSFELILCDRSSDLVRAWRQQFSDNLGVKITQGNILTTQADAVAVPANSFGYTDGGVDVAISREVFDWKLQDKLMKVIDQQFFGELLVGQALVLPTDSNAIRYAIVAPTMRLPGDVSTSINAYLAMRAILITAELHNRANVGTPSHRIRTLAVPGLCTGVGKMPPNRAAYQMLKAFANLRLGDVDWNRSLEKQAEHDRKLREFV